MAKLTTGERKAMPKSDFALPGKRQGGKGGYPIPDASHARNALSRVSQNGTPSEKARVREKVREKFPGIGQSKGSRGSVPRGEHYQANHREPRSADEFHQLGNKG